MPRITTGRVPGYEYRFEGQDLTFTETVLQTMPTETKGTSSSTVMYKKIRLNKADGSRMPDAYSKSVENDGSLVDYFICDKSQVWMPQQ